MGADRWVADARRRRLLAGADLVAVTLCSTLVLSGRPGSLWALASAPLWLLTAKALGLYDRDHRVLRHLTIDELPSIIAWAGIVAGTIAGTLALAGEGALSLGTLVLLATGLAAADIATRAAARAVWRRTTPPASCLVIGEDEPSASLIRKFNLFADMHLLEAGKLDPGEFENRLGEDPAAVQRHLASIDRVVVATSSLSQDLVARLATLCRENQVKLSAVSSLHGRGVPTPRISQVADLPILEFDTSDMSRSTLALKRGFDVAVALGALLLSAPLVPLIALAIKLDSRGPVLFKQWRAGFQGRPFRLYKFRTMRQGAERELDRVVSIERLAEPAFKLRRDPRLTRVGRVLRKLSLDELPQVVNVLKGEMSVVGPRPEQVELVERYTSEQRVRLEVKPGITGPMQVYGRGDLTFAERLSLDIDYIENLSLARDLRIIFLTLPVVASRNGAY